jgi:translation initiation factor IF-3
VVAPHASRAGLSAFTVSCANAHAGMVPVRTRSDVGGHISTEPRINDRIRVPEVRLVGPSGEQVGIVSITDALRLAQEADLDLVEVAPTARPPVAKLMDFGKFKYESALKARESRKNQAQTVIKEIKIRPKIDPHDYGTKKGHVERFLRQGDKVKVTIMFRGREQSRPELGYKLLQRLAGDVEELGFVESQPKQDGRNMIMVIGPHRKKTDVKAVRAQDRASARATAPAAAQDSGSQGPQPRPNSAAGGPRPGPGSRPAPAAPGSATSQAASSQATPRPGPPRPGSPAGSPRPAAPRPGPSSGGPRPAAPKPGPAGSAARLAAAAAGAPRPQASKPGAGRPVPTPGARASEPGAPGAEAGG